VAASTKRYAGYKRSITHYLSCGVTAAITQNRKLAAGIFVFRSAYSVTLLLLCRPIVSRKQSVVDLMQPQVQPPLMFYLYVTWLLFFQICSHFFAQRLCPDARRLLFFAQRLYSDAC
jgi:hypothetical protein